MQRPVTATVMAIFGVIRNVDISTDKSMSIGVSLGTTLSAKVLI